MNEKYFHGKMPTWNDVVEHPNYDEFRQKQAFPRYIKGSPRVPNLNVVGAARAGSTSAVMIVLTVIMLWTSIRGWFFSGRSLGLEVWPSAGRLRWLINCGV